ncbi:metal-dependent hydrolase [Candidatus Dependentiae bacterium]
MPGYRAHVVGGLAVYGITLYLLRSQCGSVFLAAEWLLFALAGSLFPDIDTQSKAQKIFYHILLVMLIILAIQRKFLMMGVVGIAAMIPIIARHRGLFHRPWFVIGFPSAVAAAIGLYAPAYARIIFFDALFFIVGALSHLFLDRFFTTCKMKRKRA